VKSRFALNYEGLQPTGTRAAAGNYGCGSEDRMRPRFISSQLALFLLVEMRNIDLGKLICPICYFTLSEQDAGCPFPFSSQFWFDLAENIDLGISF